MNALELIEECIRTKNPYLDLGCCGLTDADVADCKPIDRALRKCTHVKTLILSNEWFDWEKREWVGSQNGGVNNFFTTYPSALLELSQLEVLRCGGDSSAKWKIKDMAFVAGLKQLILLDISFNQIRELEGLENLVNLKYFIIYYNQITELKGLENLANLQSFYIFNNQIRELKVLENLTNLHIFDIYENQIKELKGLENLVNLQTFSIHSNQIKELKGLENLVNLQILNITYNQISEIKGLENLANLKTFYINGNQITGLKGLEVLGNLQSLSISYNHIRDIRPLVPFLQREKKPLQIKWQEYADKGEISVAENPLTQPPIEIVEQGNEAILAWFEEADKHNLQPLNECKLIFVGDGAVGKTSLMKQLVWGEFKKGETTTHGINKVAWKEIHNEKGEAIRVNLWDFGGQHVQHSLHQFFFTRRVIYVLILSPRNDNNGDYWLEQVEKLGCDSDILVVYNWKDEKDKQAPYLGNYYELKKKYPKLGEPFLLSCATGEGVKAFKDKLMGTILAQEDLGIQYPSNWYEIKRSLEQVTGEKDYIPYEQYGEICDRNDYSDEEKQRSLLVMLDKIGSIVFFNQPILDKLQVLNPDWITAGAYTILTSEVTNRKKGHLNHDDLVEIFKEEVEVFAETKKRIRFRAVQFDFILQLMLKFDLCQKNPFSANEYLIPVAFGGEPPKDYSAYKRGGKQYRFQFPSAFEMIIMHKFIARNIAKCTDKDYWLSGLLIKDPHSKTFALVETNQYSQLIDFWISGENIRGFWEVLRNDMKEVYKDYHAFQPEEQVYYEKDGKTAFFSYQEMLKYLKNGIAKIDYHPSSDMKNVDVWEVIDMFENSRETKARLEIHVHGDNNVVAADVDGSRFDINKG